MIIVATAFAKTTKGDACTLLGLKDQQKGNFLSFSDYFAHVVQFILPDPLSKVLSPKSRPSFKLTAEVIKDQLFKERLGETMLSWQRVGQFQDESSRQLGTLYWLDMLVKPGIKKLAQQRSKEINRARREELNLLLLRQIYLTRKLVILGQSNQLGELQHVHLLIERWYAKECEKVQHQSRVDEFQSSRVMKSLLSILMSFTRQ
jgi:hypothetical protein